MIEKFITYLVSSVKAISGNAFGIANFIVMSIMTYIAPISINIIAVLAFILVDLILGYYVSRRMGDKKVKSSLLWDTLHKMVFATMLIIGLYTIDVRIATSVNLHAVEWASALICATELISWIELMATVNPNSIMLRIIRSVFGDIIKNKSEKYLGTKIDIEKLMKDSKKKKKTK